MHNSRHTNRLITEKSLYLLQHAHNPVEWYSWGTEAFNKAKKEQKPIFLSIGYSTCHWCHVMAHVSFEDQDVAKLLNETFICIKVDREERPDIDSIYMSICHLITGSGGWPLTIIMTPNKEPFFAATYIPKENRYRRIGLLALIPQIKELWSSQKKEVLQSAHQITSILKKTSQYSNDQATINKSLLKTAFTQLRNSYDHQYGGFGTAPKFPTPHNLRFLLRYWKRTNNNKALAMVEQTLEAMHFGGIYAHIGYGFHRYSMDRYWCVPHFEKMLYDQALLAMAYIEAYQATGKKNYAQTTREIFNYVLRDMTSPQGGFYCAEDADSEGIEGKFYLWRYEELQQILTRNELEIITKLYDIKNKGNFTEKVIHGKTDWNIFYKARSVHELSTIKNGSEKNIRNLETLALKKLFSFREERVHPDKDDKILTDWNGLMIAALAKGSRVLDEPRYASVAQRAVEFILTTMRTPDGGLFHRFRSGESALRGNVDDYVFFIHGLLELYQTVFDVSFLNNALDLNRYLLDHFWDDEGGGFYFTPDDGETILIRKKEIYDGAIPSGNSIAMLNLLYLSRLIGDSKLEEKASKIAYAFSKTVQQMPSSYTELMNAIDFQLGPSYEVVVAGNSQKLDTKQILKEINRYYIPSILIILRPTEEESPDTTGVAKFTKDYVSLNGKPTVYICHNFTCKKRLTNLSEILDLLKLEDIEMNNNYDKT